MTTPPIPTKEPETFYAGDTLKFQITLGDYPADTWTLTYSLVKDGTQIQFTASASGQDHLVNVAAATTAAYTVGTYNYVGRVTDGTSSYVARRGQMEIKTDFAAASGGFDGRSHVKTTLDALESTIEGKATKDQLNYAINGRSLSRMSPQELTTWHSHYRALYNQELADERVSRGQGTGNKIRVSF